jgi:hypothetical protein
MAAPILVNGMTGVNATPQFVDGPGAKLMDFCIFNAAAATSFVSFYDTQLAPTVGTTVPKFQVGITTLGTAVFSNLAPDGLFFRDGLWVAATTTAAGNTNPATALVVSLGVN